MRFDTPGVLDLAQRDLRAGAIVVPTAPLPDADAERIFAASAVGEDPPLLRFSDDEYGCAKSSRRCSQEHERARLAQSGGTVRRDGRRLLVTPRGGVPVVFVDWTQPATRSADGDQETHWYLGAMPGSGYLRVEVRFGHDAPGDFLVDPQSGKTAFVHNGADLVGPSPDGRLLVTWNALNPPLTLRVAALDAGGPRLVVTCAAPDREQRLTPVFKGWQGDAAFGFVVEIGEPSKAMPRLALRLARESGAWRLNASDPQRLAATGIACVAGG